MTVKTVHRWQVVFKIKKKAISKYDVICSSDVIFINSHLHAVKMLTGKNNSIILTLLLLINRIALIKIKTGTMRILFIPGQNMMAYLPAGPFFVHSYKYVSMATL